jgi:hypothetical protein
MTVSLIIPSIVAGIAMVIVRYGFRALRRIEIWGRNLDERDRAIWESGFSKQSQDERARPNQSVAGRGVTEASGTLPRIHPVHFHN